MSRMVIRPPAARVHLLPQQGPLTASSPAQFGGPPGDLATPARDLGRQTFGAVDASKSYGGRVRGQIDKATTPPFQTVWQDRIQVNPVSEQPRLIFYSGAQPFIRWGAVRRYVRTFMTASARFQGRWAYVGFIQRRYTERPRLTGNPSAARATYVLQRPSSGPRSVMLNG